MKKSERKGVVKRLLSFLLASAMLLGYIPAAATTAQAETVTGKTADTATFERLEPDNGAYLYRGDTLHAGKVTVDKSVMTSGISHKGVQIPLTDSDNFLVAVSQMSQVMALTKEMQTPVDVVFVLDTSSSMSNSNKVGAMVTAANNAIETLLSANENNRVGVVAFSGTQGGGTSNNAAASVLTHLGHYDGEGETNHLYWVNSNGNASGNSRNYIRGRGTNSGYRHGTSQGTNIHAGVVLGGQMLAHATDTTVTVNGQSVTRMPFLVIMSDGQPSYAASGDLWYNPSLTTQIGNLTQAAGIGFLPALAAAYYKGLITEHYYGTTTDTNTTNRCYVYTMGLGLDTLDNNSQNLAMMTMDPSNTGSSNTYYDDFNSYWNSYMQGRNFTVETRSSGSNDYTVKAATITDSKPYVLGTNLGYSGTFRYNDDYFNASTADQLGEAFTKVVQSIQEQAIASPTRVSGADYNFDGYVTFTDVIGEYMEVKDMKGILVGDTFYQGRHVARNIGNSRGNDYAFDAVLRQMIAKRITLSDSGVTNAAALAKADELIAASVAKEDRTQAYYNESTGEYSNSVVWFGKSYTTGDGFEHGIQYIAPAEDDSVEYLSAATTQIPADADTVCRSYFFYGTAEAADGSQSDNNTEYMYFVVRVERQLTEPYQQTVTISAPASLLAVEKVYITEDTTGTAPEYTAKVEQVNPAHVVYEVGLRSDINEYNITTKVSSDYAAEKPADGVGHVNSEGDTYYFFTNDWDRTMASSTHQRAQSKATFYAAANNPYYTYQEDTYLRNDQGEVLKSLPASGRAYYYRDVYSWSGSATDGEYKAVKTQELIPITIPSGATVSETGAIRSDATGIYITAGTYTAAVMSPDGSEDISKGTNYTYTSEAVAHPVRTGEASNPHYTVYLGNNGVLPLTARTAKTVSVNGSATNDDGKAVMVGDTLTYRIEAKNLENKKATLVVTDQVPTGTEFVSADNDGVYDAATGSVTWTFADVDAGAVKHVSFQVRVTEDALTVTGDTEVILNTAHITINNTPAYTTNTTYNPPAGKRVTDANNGTITGTLQIGDVLQYHVHYANNADSAATITITDQIPAGTTYVADSASFSGDKKTADNSCEYSGGKLTWTLKNVAPGADGVVTFRVYVDASAKVDPAAAVQPETGTISIVNKAEIKIGSNDPRQTNETTNTAGVGDISVSKTVTKGSTNKTFTVIFSESEGKLSGTYRLIRVNGSNETEETITFTNGVANNVTVAHGDTVIVKGLPLGAVISVTEHLTETNDPGWSDAYNVRSVKVTGSTGSESAVDVSITNEYNPKPVTFQLTGTKTFIGADLPEDVTFTFTATQCNEDGSEYTAGTPATVTGNVTMNKAGTATFALTGRTFYAATEPRYYIISEDSVSYPGLLTDTKQYRLKIQILDDNVSGQLIAKAWILTDAGWTELDWQNDSQTISFTNILPSDTDVTIRGTKVLDGRYIGANEFSVRLKDKAGNVIANEIVSGNGTSATGSFSFNLKYTALDMADAVNGEKTFHYTVEEVNNHLTGVEYDTSVFDLTVKVKVNADGTMTATPSVMKGGSAATLEFKNSFESVGVSVKLGATKSFTNNASSEPLTAGMFSFGVFRADSSYSYNQLTDLIVGAANEADGKVKFTDINYTHDFFLQNRDKDAQNNPLNTMTRYYVVKEMIPAADAPTFNPDMKYDTAERKIKVVVTYNPADGTMSAAVTDHAGNPLTADNDGRYNVDTFSNILQKNQIEFDFAGSKKIIPAVGREIPAGLSFSFKVVGVTVKDGTITEGVEEGTGISAPTSASDTEVTSTIDFTKLVFTRDELNGQTSRDFWFWIMESNTGSSNGITYDARRYLLKLTLSVDSDLTLKLTPQFYKQINTGDVSSFANYTEATESDIIFENTYNAYAGLNLKAAKNLTGKTLQDRSFDFLLQRIDSDGKLTGNQVAGTNTGSVVSFATLYFTNGMFDGANHKVPAVAEEKDPETGDVITPAAPEKYYLYYLMSELEPTDAKIPGVTYDKAQYIVIVELYESQVSDGSGTSTVLNANLYGVVKANAPVEGVYSVTLPSTGMAPGTESTGVTFENSYSPNAFTSATIEATKKLTGQRGLKEGEFTFELYRVDGTKEHLVTSATNDAAGNISFVRNYNISVLDPSGFDADDNYKVIYHLKEVDPAQGGVDYVSGEYWVQVTIHHNKANASYSVTDVSYYSDAALTTSVDADNVEFVNDYTPNTTTLAPSVTKELLDKSGKLMAVTDNQFSFRVYELKNEGGTLVQGDMVATSSMAAYSGAANVAFTKLEYTSAGTYFYKIVEIPGIDSTITYDTAAYYWKVTVSDDGQGNLTPTGQYYSDISFADEKKIDSVKFTNHYGPGVINIALQLNKRVDVYDAHGLTQYQYPLTDSQFDFTAVDANGDPVASGSNDPSGLISFTSIPVTRADIYGGADKVKAEPKSADFVYTITEIVPGDAADLGITVDNNKITVTVTVTDDGYGNLSSSVKSIVKEGVDQQAPAADHSTFVNRYTLKSTTYAPAAHKTLINKVLEAGEFTFVLMDSTKAAIQSKTNAADGTVTFDALTFVRPGTYVYYMNETDKGGNYTCDTTLFKIVVTVSADISGQLHAVPLYYKVDESGTENEVGGIAFTNSYTPSGITADLTLAINGKKTVEDVNGNALTHLDHSGFWFKVADAQGTNIFGSKYAVSDEDGLIVFDPFSFPAAGEYRYWITEVDNPEKVGYIEDTSSWAVHILVSYNAGPDDITYTDAEGKTAVAKPGELYLQKSDVKILKTSESQEGSSAALHPVFVNIYDPKPAQVTVVATKKLVGRELKDHEFGFYLVDQNGNLRSESANHANGRIEFRLNYTQADMTGATANADGKLQKTFTYTIYEKVPEGAVDGVYNGVTYVKPTDGKPAYVTVVDNNGVLEVIGENIAYMMTSAEFVNTYTAADGVATVYAHKILNGADLSQFNFEFQLENAAGEILKASSDTEGTAKFELVYTFDDMLDEDGNRLTEKTFTYKLRETDKGWAGMIYSEDEIEVTVKVTDDQLGNLVTEVFYAASPTFTNVYEGTSALAGITATKKLTGKDLAEGDFTFELLDEAGEPAVEDVRNDASGHVNFVLELTKKGTYTYYIHEKAGTDSKMHYDSNLHKVTVEVTEDPNTGVLTANVTYHTDDGKAPVILNVYTPDSVFVKLEGTKELKGRDMKTDEFKFSICDEEGELLGSGTNTSDGKIIFESIALDAVGTYEWTVSEVDTKLDHVTYSTETFRVKVVVTNENGVLKASVTYPDGDIKFVNTYDEPEIPTTEPEETKPESNSPDTGDKMPLGILIAVMVICALAIVVILMMMRPKSKGKFTK